jgi:hypothetical protein
MLGALHGPAAHRQRARWHASCTRSEDAAPDQSRMARLQALAEGRAIRAVLRAPASGAFALGQTADVDRRGRVVCDRRRVGIHSRSRGRVLRADGCAGGRAITLGCATLGCCGDRAPQTAASASSQARKARLKRERASSWLLRAELAFRDRGCRAERTAAARESSRAATRAASRSHPIARWLRASWAGPA